MERESDTRRAVNQAMISDGDHERFKQLLRRRLNECGWCDQIRMLCKESIREQGSNVLVDQLLEEVSQKGRALVPTAIKRELLQEVKDHLLRHAGYYSAEGSNDVQKQ